jgi:hypothetical protein
MSDVGTIGILAALGFCLVVLLAFIQGLIEQFRNRNKKPKTSTKPIVSNESEEDKEDRELSSEDSEGDGLFFGDPLFPPEFDGE